jgi:hypothetical protein
MSEPVHEDPVLMQRYSFRRTTDDDGSEVVVLLFPAAPPRLVQRLLFPLLARLGERRGYRPGRFAEIT